MNFKDNLEPVVQMLTSTRGAKDCDFCYDSFNYILQLRLLMYVITGGGSGIGRATALELAKRNQSVLIIGRREIPLMEVASLHALIDYQSADVSSEKGRLSLVEKIGKDLPIRGLIHNAGVIDPIIPIEKMDVKNWQKVMATNVEAPLFLTQGLHQNLKNGRVLNIGSGAAHFPVAGWSAYCASKAALSMLTKCWQLECTDFSFANVMPGIIDTDMQEKIRQSSSMDAEKIEFFRQLQQKNLLISPDAVAKFLCWLLLDIDDRHFSSCEWDIYDETHHSDWLYAPSSIPKLES